MKKSLIIVAIIILLLVSGCKKAPDIIQESFLNSTPGVTDTGNNDKTDEIKGTPEPGTSDRPGPAETTGVEGSESELPKTEAPQTTIPKTQAPKSETPKTATPAPSTSKPGSSAPAASNNPGVNEHIYNQPTYLINNVNINPKHVYYQGSKLYMVAFVTNGFMDRTVFNIHDITIRLSNQDVVIAEGYFSSMPNAVIGPYSYITWTFVFDESAVITQNADLTYLKTESKVNYWY